MGQAVQLKQQEYINFQGIPAGFWSGDEWSVMTLVKFHDDGILGIGKENPVLGDGIPATNQGFHLGMKNKVSPYQHKDLHNFLIFCTHSQFCSLGMLFWKCLYIICQIFLVFKPHPPFHKIYM